jgi:RNA 2',3'-cyclic 3'-phosphodiesterase
MKHYTARMHQDLFGISQSVVHNVFFGLMPDDAGRARMAEAVESLRAAQSPQGRWLKPARYHMTLHFLGTFSELPGEKIAAAIRAAEGLHAPAFELVLDRAGSFSGGIGWLGCTHAEPPLQQLWEELRQALAREHVSTEGHARFTPHVTVLRDASKPIRDVSIDPIRWPIREVMLVDSQLGDRNEYRPLGRWQLR